MTTAAKLVALGEWPASANAVAGGDLGNNLSAAGTTQATATPIGNDIAIFTTVAASSGAILPNQGSAYITVFNNNATNALSIYPPVGGVINQLAANAAFSVGANKSSVFVTPDGVTWVATHSS